MKAMLRAVGVIFVCAATAAGHPPDANGHHDDGHEHIEQVRLRAWSNIRTGQVVQGAFLAARTVDGAVRVAIEREYGDVVLVALADLDEASRVEVQRRIDGTQALNDGLLIAHGEQHRRDGDDASPAQAAPFRVFAPFVETRWDDRWLYVESDGLPHTPGGAKGTYVYSHPMMVGISAWQQQVPLPQAYRGGNAWRIPLRPEIADAPVSAKEQLFRGAIALAVNGVPIFNPIKNDGRTDTFLAGELDEFGGHCGRADDYHYHVAPTHLQRYVGSESPIAYALDGFPIYGLFDPAAKKGQPGWCPAGGMEKLDALNGHHGAPPPGSPDGAKGPYHYHASKTYPYLNGGLRGKITIRDDQIEPQPRARPVRDWLQPLRGASITGFKATGAADKPAWSLEYMVAGKSGFVNYWIAGQGDDAKYVFEFVGTDGSKSTQTYSAGGQDRRGAPQNDRERPRRRDRPRADVPRDDHADELPAAQTLVLRSDDVVDGRLSTDCTCDGQGRAPILTWTEPPAGTKALAIVMHHVPPEGGAHVYLIAANLPSKSREFKSGRDDATWGANTVNRQAEYTPPCSQGPGDKRYTITLYALSVAADVRTGVTRDELLERIADRTLATATMEVVSARVEDAPRRDRPHDQRRGRGDEQDAPGGGLLARMTAFKTDVPAHDVNVVLARPTERSMTVSISLKAGIAGGLVEYWRASGGPRLTAPIAASGAGSITNVELAGLAPGTAYRYRVGWRPARAETVTWGDEFGFRTRPTGAVPGGFTFVVQADSHLDQGVEPAVYRQTLENMASGKPDFVIDLGDTFMTDKRGPDFKAALAQYDAQRYYLGLIARSAPLFMVLGNHDGEKGTSGRGADDIGPWSYCQRTTRFPPPLIDGNTYTGLTTMSGGIGANYYAFEWGDAQFIVLDPFWRTTERVRGGGGNRAGEREPRQEAQPLKPIDSSWSMTLGREQYQWLRQSLAVSKARYRFVFIHHLVGGVGGAESRGGVESAAYFEWGGKNADGSEGFAEHRPGWAMPIHDLLAQHHVSAVIHGHDHLYVRGERDGVVYQCVPQPGNPRGNTRTAAQYGYASGKVLGSPGHLRVRVEPEKATVEFVRTIVVTDDLPRRNDRRGSEDNGDVVHRYVITPNAAQ